MSDEGITGMPQWDLIVGVVIGCLIGILFILGGLVPYSSGINTCMNVVIVTGVLFLGMYWAMKSSGENYDVAEDIPNRLKTAGIALVAAAVVVIAFIVLSSAFSYVDKNYGSVLSTPFKPAIENETHKSQALHNYPGAERQPRSVIKAFVLSDPTYNISYAYPGFTSCDYAVRLHDNAERAGIQSGIARITFRDGDTPNISWGKESVHWINVFNMTGPNFVYIDATHIDGPGGPSGPMFAFVQKGNRYGIMSLAQNDRIDPAYYSTFDSALFLKDQIAIMENSLQHMPDNLTASERYFYDDESNRLADYKMRLDDINATYGDQKHWVLPAIKDVTIYW